MERLIRKFVIMLGYVTISLTQKVFTKNNKENGQTSESFYKITMALSTRAICF